jgi:hypothetical protein
VVFLPLAFFAAGFFLVVAFFAIQMFSFILEVSNVTSAQH